MSHGGSVRQYVYFSVASGILIGLILIPFLDRATRRTTAKVDHLNRTLREPPLTATKTSVLPAFALARPPQIVNTAIETLSRIADEQNPKSCDERPCLALTFDDGPNVATTPVILDALAHQHAKASFFLVGNRIGSRADIVKRVFAEGHDIGNHSWSHPNFGKLSVMEVEQQVNNTQNAVTALGLPAPHLFRPPYGRLTPAQSERVHIPTIMWNIDPQDWHEADPNKIIDLIVAQAKPGGIMVLHDIKPATAAAIERAVIELKKHYQLVTVSKLLELDPDSQGLYFSR